MLNWGWSPNVVELSCDKVEVPGYSKPCSGFSYNPFSLRYGTEAGYGESRKGPGSVTAMRFHMRYERRDGRTLVYFAWRSEGWQGAQAGDISGFKYMKACCENHGEQMFHSSLKTRLNKECPYLLAQGTLNENLGKPS